MLLQATSIAILCAKNYEDQFKLLSVTEENLANVFETHGQFRRLADLRLNELKQFGLGGGLRSQRPSTAVLGVFSPRHPNFVEKYLPPMFSGLNLFTQA